MDQKIDVHGLQSIVHQIVASNLTGVMFARMETYKAAEPHKDYSLEENYVPIVERATKDVMNMYGIIWQSLEKWSNNPHQPKDDTDPGISL